MKVVYDPGLELIYVDGHPFSILFLKMLMDASEDSVIRIRKQHGMLMLESLTCLSETESYTHIDTKKKVE